MNHKPRQFDDEPSDRDKFANDLCTALGLDMVKSLEINLRLGVDEVPTIRVERYLLDRELNEIIQVIQRYKLNPTILE